VGVVTARELAYTPSPAGPAEPGAAVQCPPVREDSKIRQTLGFVFQPLRTNLDAQRRFGDVWSIRILTEAEPFAVTCHPDHIKALVTAGEQTAPSMTGESQLRPVLGPGSVLTANGDAHLRQRKLLLPPFHGDAVERYAAIVERATERELSRWQVGRTFALAPRMQALTLDVITAGVFGMDLAAARGSAERRLSDTLRWMLLASATPVYQLVELQNAGRTEPRGPLRAMRAFIDRQIDAVIRERRADGGFAERDDVLSLLLRTRDEDGLPLTDGEIRDELLTLVLAGHETTANSLAWLHERMLRTPAAYDRLRDMVRRDDPRAGEYVEATIHEGMRIRPVIPVIGRFVRVPWRLGEYVVPADSPVVISIVALHHRPDLYPDPSIFRPERFLDAKPGTYTWLPFGGGVRRCLGAALAMIEQRIVLRAMAAGFDLRPAGPRAERPQQRNVTMIPSRGARVTVDARI
jgi:cytochrome P450